MTEIVEIEPETLIIDGEKYAAIFITAPRINVFQCDRLMVESSEAVDEKTIADYVVADSGGPQTWRVIFCKKLPE